MWHSPTRSRPGPFEPQHVCHAYTPLSLLQGGFFCVLLAALRVKVSNVEDTLSYRHHTNEYLPACLPSSPDYLPACLHAPHREAKVMSPADTIDLCKCS